MHDNSDFNAPTEASHARLQQEIDSLRETVATYRTLLDESSDPIFSFYPDGTYRYVNRAFADGVGFPQEFIIGRKIWDVFSKDEADKRFAIVQYVFTHGEMKVIEVRVPRSDGDHYYITTAKPIMNEDGKVISVICISKEITERKRMEEELRRVSMYDWLTDLYNRRFFENEVERIQHDRMYPISVVVVDLNHLKQVNDGQGHVAGDDLIRAAGRVLKQTFRDTDIIARYGGDEFVVLLPHTSELDVMAIVERLRVRVAMEDNPNFSLSIGVATANAETPLINVIREADDRMYQEKAVGRGR